MIILGRYDVVLVTTLAGNVLYLETRLVDKKRLSRIKIGKKMRQKNNSVEKQ